MKKPVVQDTRKSTCMRFCEWWGNLSLFKKGRMFASAGFVGIGAVVLVSGDISTAGKALILSGMLILYGGVVMLASLE